MGTLYVVQWKGTVCFPAINRQILWQEIRYLLGKYQQIWLIRMVTEILTVSRLKFLVFTVIYFAAIGSSVFELFKITIVPTAIKSGLSSCRVSLFYEN